MKSGQPDATGPSVAVNSTPGTADATRPDKYAPFGTPDWAGALLRERMAENLDAFCERCGKAAVSPLAKPAAAPKGLRLLLGARSTKVEPPVSALQLCLGPWLRV